MRVNWKVIEENFNLEDNFKVCDYLGSGAYGVVCAVFDEDTNSSIAIKKCKGIFQSKTMAKRMLREIRLLRLFDHRNIVKLKTILLPTDLTCFNSLYVAFELMETDLAQIIRSPQTLKDQHVQYFTYQLVQALKYLHDGNVVHRDIKYDPFSLFLNTFSLFLRLFL